jgi:hypothetical protein
MGSPLLWPPFFSPTRPVLHRPTWSSLFPTPQACQTCDPQAYTPKACQALHNLCWAHAPQAHQTHALQASTISTWPPLLSPTRPMLHRPTRSLPGPCPSALPGLQSTGPPDLCSTEHSSSCSPGPWKQASAWRPVGPCPLVTCQGRALNLPRRHWQKGLDAKVVKPELLRLKFYCSRTGNFFFLPSFKRLAVWSSTISPCCFPWFSFFVFFYLSFFLFFSFFLGFVNFTTVTQLTLNYTLSRDKNGTNWKYGKTKRDGNNSLPQKN